MKVIALAGSPRKSGNSTILLEKALQGAKEQGAATEIFYLNEMNIKGCQACAACKTTGKCAVKDDLVKVYESLNEADAVVIGSPVYFGRFSAQTALFMDRLYAYLKPDFSSSLASGKKYGLIFTQGQPDVSLYQSTITATGQVLERLGITPAAKALVGAGLLEAGAVNNNEKYLQAAQSLGKILATK